MATIRGGSSLTDGNLNLHFVFTICWQKMEISVWNIFFCTFFFFSARGFANSRAYKIKNTGVDGPCPSYKIKSIAFEQRKTLGLWMSFGWPFGLLDGHRKYQELGFPTGCGEKRWKCHHNTSKIKEWKIVKKCWNFSAIYWKWTSERLQIDCGENLRPDDISTLLKS